MKIEAPMTKEVVMALKHMDLSWHLGFDIWVCSGLVVGHLG
jgi:hypothetical protein